ncbi:MAG: YjgN family protein, partial [Rickettsiaceae bacterium]|nr:YjgN family protein [Rickettsiaceae bacterium]MDP5020472.1 YjgN family protein [Rickettsiaceae bacterium]
MAEGPMQNNNIKNRFEYEASTSKIFGIWILNFFLSIITIGIYSFWGKTKMRKYIANSFSLLGDRFEYNGTGGELFRGFLKALPIIIIVYMPFIIWDQEEDSWVILMFIPILCLVYMAIYAALRYRLSRTTWRGIRGKLTGSAFCFAKKNMIRQFLNIITLGLLIPSSDIKIYKYIAENMHFGNTPVKFDGNAKSLFGINLITLLLAIPTVGLSRIWYSAALTRYTYGHTTINNLRFKANYTGSSLLALHIVN